MPACPDSVSGDRSALSDPAHFPLDTVQGRERGKHYVEGLKIGQSQDDALPEASHRAGQRSHGTLHRAHLRPTETPPEREQDEPSVVDEGSMVYNGVYAEDIYLGRATRVRCVLIDLRALLVAEGFAGQSHRG